MHASKYNITANSDYQQPPKGHRYYSSKPVWIIIWEKWETASGPQTPGKTKSSLCGNGFVVLLLCNFLGL